MNPKIKTNSRKLIFLVFMSCVFLLPTQLVFAQTQATNSSDNTTQEEQEKENSTIDNIKKVIQEKKTELGSISAELHSEKACLAKVLRVSEETLTVSHYSGNKIIPLEKEVLIQNEDGKDIKISEIAVDDWVGVYSEVLEENLKIKKVILYKQDFSPKDKIITLGSISSIGKNDLKITPRSGEKELTFSFDKTTAFQDYQGETAKLAEFYEDLQCLVVAFADKNGNYVISTIRALSNFEK